MAAVTGVLLLGAMGAPAAQAAGVDETELAQLRADIAATGTAWSNAGGTDVTRCTMSFGGASASSRSTVEFSGGAGPVHVRYGSSSVVTAGARASAQLTASAHVLLATAATRASGGGGTQAYLTAHAAITPLPGRVRTALGRHGLRTDRQWAAQPYGSVADPSLSRAAYRSATSLDAGLVGVVTFGRVTALTAASDGTTTTYRGTAVDPSVRGEVDPLDFTVVVSGGAVTRVVVALPAAEDELGMRCRSRLTLGGTSVHVPPALTRHPKVVSAETSLLGLSGQIAGTASLMPRDQRARVRMVQALAWSLARPGKKGPHVTVTELANGVALTRQVRGWSHPLRWQVTVRNGHVHAYPVVTARQGGHG